ncbi:MAG: oligopeptide transporter, OPT family [bacterium]|nr:oligopeptide transporter, OPT family [bacterium]
MDTGRSKREITVTAVLLGILLAVVFGAANAYLGLRVGLTVSASVPAAVISMGVLRFVLRRDSILENNMVQTIGSAGESLAAGAIFTMPALYLWAQEGICLEPGLLPLTLIALAGGVLGVLLMVPLRRPLIVEEEKSLVYPEGRACADVLRAGEVGARRAKVVFWGVAGAALVKIVAGGLKWVPETIALPIRSIRGALGFEVSPALLGVGYVVGPKIATLLFAGAALGWVVLIPFFSFYVPDAATAWEQGGAMAVWKGYVRYVGAGAIAMGGFLSLVRSMPLFARTFAQSVKGIRANGTGNGAFVPPTERDLPMGRVLAGLTSVIVFIWAVPAVPVGFLGAVLIALFGFFFAAVSARMVGLVGSSNNPISGMTIATLVIASLVLKSAGTVGAQGMLAAIAIGSVVCIVAAIAGDTAQDLKTGRILGATPWKQQVGELVGVTASALTIGGVLVLLHKAWGFGSDAISAPQAMLMKTIVEGIMGDALPWGYLAFGAGLALVLAACRVQVMPFAIGLYLPIGLNATMFAGGLVRYLVDRRRGEQPESENSGVLLSAGLIAGEGLCGILLAVLTLVLR